MSHDVIGVMTVSAAGFVANDTGKEVRSADEPVRIVLCVVVAALSLIESAAIIFRVGRNDVQIRGTYAVVAIGERDNIVKSLVWAVVIDGTRAYRELLPSIELTYMSTRYRRIWNSDRATIPIARSVSHLCRRYCCKRPI